MAKPSTASTVYESTHILVNKINQCLCQVSECQSISEKNSQYFLLCVVTFERFLFLIAIYISNFNRDKCIISWTKGSENISSDILRKYTSLLWNRENQINTNDQYYKPPSLRWNKLLTFTNKRITLFFIPQSTATTFMGFPLPYTLTSCHFKNQSQRECPAMSNTSIS